MTQVRKPALLVIMDGCGLAPEGPDNAVSLAKRPYFKELSQKYLYTTLGASGEDVGLPEGQMGNSEVGHLNIGAGRIVFQELSRINNAVKDGSINSNHALLKAINKVKDANSCLHVMGLVSPGGVHSTQGHALAIIRMAAQLGVKKIRLDAFTDGRDVAPQSGVGYMAEVASEMERIAQEFNADIAVASVSGRYYAMDRDNRWERVERAYNALVLGDAPHKPCAVEGLKEYYAKDERGDEFVAPFVVDGCGIQQDDAVIFFNFRPDRAREITRALTDPDFTGFERKKFIKDLCMVTMTVYDPELKVDVAFPKYIPENVLADVLANEGLTQLHTAETEKYAHVTFFLNGGVEPVKEGETRVLVPSPKVATYDLQPEMSAPEVTEKLKQAIKNDEADFYVVNYANCDMVGHTGVLEAAVKATEAVDEGLSQIIPEILAKGGFALITADHGNADHMYDVVEGAKKPFTAHTTNRVPLIIVDDQPQELADIQDGRLSDIAPTILHMMNLAIPLEMDGRVLVK